MPKYWTKMFRWSWLAGIVLAAAVLSACGQTPPAAAQAESALGSDGPTNAQRRFGTDTPRLVVLGDSLTAGLGLELAEAYPARLQEYLDAAGYHVQIVNAGVSGDTTTGALRRLDWALSGGAEILVVALGGNDGLRGLPVDQMKKNLSQIIMVAKARGIKVLLAGMEAPPNFGEVYTTAFREVFRQLAREHDVAWVPFLLEGVAGVPNLNQPDGIHPTAEGATRIAKHVWPAVERLVQQMTIGDGQ
jgi:acyl-CoA thioesterase-1